MSTEQSPAFTVHPKLHYLCGYFDGEACITVLKGSGRSPQLEVKIVSSDKTILELFGELTGVPPYEVTKTHSKKGLFKRRLFRWGMNGSRALQVLRILEPSLIAKREQARIALSVDWETRTRKAPIGRRYYSSALVGEG